MGFLLLSQSSCRSLPGSVLSTASVGAEVAPDPCPPRLRPSHSVYVQCWWIEWSATIATPTRHVRLVMHHASCITRHPASPRGTLRQATHCVSPTLHPPRRASPATAPSPPMALRRGGGISALARDSAAQASYSSLAADVNAAQLSELRAQLDSFGDALLRFGSEHGADIRASPDLRHAFQKMCVSIGVDPLAAPAPPPNNGSVAAASLGRIAHAAKGQFNVWAATLGLSDWVYALAVQVVDVCVSTRPANGGLISMPELISRVAILRSGKRITSAPRAQPSSTSLIPTAAEATVTAGDVRRAIKALAPLESGYAIIEAGGTTFVRSVPAELSQDSGIVLGLLARAAATPDTTTASRASGEKDLPLDAQGLPFVTRDALVQVRPGGSPWTSERAHAALDAMARDDGLLWLDLPTSGANPAADAALASSSARYYSLTVAEGVWAKTSLA